MLRVSVLRMDMCSSLCLDVCASGCKNGGRCSGPNVCTCLTGYSGVDCGTGEVAGSLLRVREELLRLARFCPWMIVALRLAGNSWQCREHLLAMSILNLRMITCSRSSC